MGTTGFVRRSVLSTAVVAITLVLALHVASRGTDADQKLTSHQLQLVSAVLGYQQEPGAIAKQVELQAETAVAQCMSAQGFDYTPSVTEPPSSPADPSGLEPPASPTEFAGEIGAQYVAVEGYGITGGIDQEVIVPEPAPDPAPNPNDVYRSGLPPEQQEAYDIALEGHAAETPVEGTETVGGCRAAAYEPLLVPVQSALIELAPELDALTEAIETDPTVVTATAGWAGCMGASGEQVPTPKAAREQIEQEFAPLEERLDVLIDQVAALPPEQQDPGSAPPELVAEAEALIQEQELLAQREVELATADQSCFVQTDLATPLEEVAETKTVEFVQENEELLDQAGFGVSVEGQQP